MEHADLPGGWVGHPEAAAESVTVKWFDEFPQIGPCGTMMNGECVDTYMNVMKVKSVHK